MLKRILRVIIISIVSSTLVALTIGRNSFGYQFVAALSAAILGSAVSTLSEIIDSNGQGLRLWLSSQIIHSNKDLYLSFSYLYRIRIDDKYLLIRGHRMKDRFQPIGGVYKYYPESKSFLNSIGCIPDTSMAHNSDETDDLRMQIKGKNLLKFMAWFQKMEDREYSPEREFYEELIKPGYIPEEQFRQLQYRKVSVHNKGITKSPVPNHKSEVIYADIFAVDLDKEQVKLIKAAVKDHSDQLILATVDEIKSRIYGDVTEMNIGNNAPWILGED